MTYNIILVSDVPHTDSICDSHIQVIKDFKNAVISKFKEIKPMIDKLGTTLEPFSKELESIKKSNSISKTGKYKNKN